MAKINCPCGAQLSNVSETQTNGYFVSDALLSSSDELEEDILNQREVWMCYECPRVWIENSGGSNVGTWYKPNTGTQ
jgi:hypothetical protein